MVSSVNIADPTAYLSQIKGLASNNAGGSASSGFTTSAGSANNQPASTSTDSVSLSSQLLSLLNGGGNSSDILQNLFDSSGISSDPLSGLYSGLLTQTAKLPAYLAAAKAQQTAQNANPVAASGSNFLNNYLSGTNAYNQTLLQNAQNIQKTAAGSLASLIA